MTKGNRFAPLRPRHVLAAARTSAKTISFAADARFVLKFLNAQPGPDTAGAKRELFELFPYGYKRAREMAGTRQPRARSTG